MNRINFLCIFLIALLTLNSCTKEEEVVCPSDPPATVDNIYMTFNATGEGAKLEANKTFKDPLGRTMEVARFKYYISNVSLLQGGAEVPIKDVDLVIYYDIDINDPNEELRQVSAIAPAGQYDGIKVGIGLDPITNSVDPGDYPSDHPLSAGQITYWGAWSKYKFIMLEGFADLSGGNNLSSIFNYHTGFDTCYREVTLAKAINIVDGGGVTSLEFNIEINDIFFGADTLDIATENSWHGQETEISRGIRISDNFAAGLKLN